MEKFFHLKENGTTVSTEVMAGLTTFFAMSYIIIVNPQILSQTGMPWGGVFLATIIAAKEAGIEGLDEILAGPTAVTFVKGDFIEAAKTLRDFAKTNKALIIKGGFADGTVYDAEGAQKLADLKSRPQLLAEFAGDIKATMSKAAYLFNALPTKAVRTIDALREKQEKAA